MKIRNLIVASALAASVHTVPAWADSPAPTSSAPDYEQAKVLGQAHVTDIAGYIIPVRLAALLGRQGSPDRLRAALQAGKIETLYHVQRSDLKGEIGSRGEMTMTATSHSKRHKVIVRPGGTPIKLGLVTSWERTGTGIVPHITYGEPSEPIKTRKETIVLSRLIDPGAQSVRTFDRSILYRIELPDTSAYGKENVAVVVVSPKATDALEGLLSSEVVPIGLLTGFARVH